MASSKIVTCLLVATVCIAFVYKAEAQIGMYPNMGVGGYGMGYPGMGMGMGGMGMGMGGMDMGMSGYSQQCMQQCMKTGGGMGFGFRENNGTEVGDGAELVDSAKK